MNACSLLVDVESQPHSCIQDHFRNLHATNAYAQNRRILNIASENSEICDMESYRRVSHITPRSGSNKLSAPVEFALLTLVSVKLKV